MIKATGCAAFLQLCISSYWPHGVVDRFGTAMKTSIILMLLQSSISPNRVSIIVTEGGRELELVVDWPNCITDLATLHKNGLSSSEPDHIESRHWNFIGFDSALKSFCEGDYDRIQSFASFFSHLQLRKIWKGSTTWAGTIVLQILFAWILRVMLRIKSSVETRTRLKCGEFPAWILMLISTIAEAVEI